MSKNTKRTKKTLTQKEKDESARKAVMDAWGFLEEAYEDPDLKPLNKEEEDD